MLKLANRPRGSTLAALMGLSSDQGQLPPREAWNINPSEAGGIDSPGLGNALSRRAPASPNGIVATPEQEAESERVAAQLGGRPDYAAILRGAMGERPDMSTGQKIASIVGPMLMAASGNEAAAMQMVGSIGSRQRDWDERNRDAELTAIKWRREDDRDEADRNKPQFLSGASDQVRYDPATGTASRVYDAPEDFETYAAAQGLQPGSEDYFGAVEDYVLRGNGPTAFKYDRDLETIRNAARISQENARQQNRLTLRQTPTYRDTNPQPRQPSRATIPTVASPAEAMKLPSGAKFRGPDGKVRVRP